MFYPGEVDPTETTFDELPVPTDLPPVFDADDELHHEPSIDQDAVVSTRNAPRTPHPAPVRSEAAPPGLFHGLVAFGLIGGGVAMLGGLLMLAMGAAVFLTEQAEGTTTATAPPTHQVP